MNPGLGNPFLTRDPQVIQQTVDEVKSQGIFDSFRRECLADVDTKPAYQNLRSKVEYSVNNFLNKQPWRPGMNKNQFRETVRNYIQTAPYLDAGVQCIVDQVVNPKIYSSFMPQIEDITYIHLGMEPPKRSQKNGNCNLKDLLPKDLDPVSPASDMKSVKEENWDLEEEEENELKKQEPSPKTEEAPEKPMENVEIKVENKVEENLNDSIKSEDKTEEEEEDSPVFEPIDIMNTNGSDDSYLSGISELTSHREQSLSMDNEDVRDHFEVSNQDSQLSKVSSNSRISIVNDIGSSNQASWLAGDDTMEKRKDSGRNFDIDMIKKGYSQDSKSGKSRSKKSESGSKESKEKSRDDSTKSKSSKDKPTSRESKSHRDKEKYEDSQKRHLSSSSSRSSSSSKEKTENANKSKDKKDENDAKNKTEKIEKKDRNDSSSRKDRNDKKDKNERKDKYDKKDRNDKKEKSDKKSSKDTRDSSKEKTSRSRENKESTEKDKHSKSSRDVKEKKDSSTDKRDVKKEHKSSSHASSSVSRHDERSSKSSKDSRSGRDRDRKDRSKKDDSRKSSSSSSRKDDKKSKSGGKNEKSDKDRENTYKDKKHRDDKKKSKDDHSSHHKNPNDRRSTDRDDSSGFGGKHSNGSLNDSSGCSKKSSSTNPNKDINIASQSSSETSDGVVENHLKADSCDAWQQNSLNQKRNFTDNCINSEARLIKKCKFIGNSEASQRSVMSNSIMKNEKHESFYEKQLKSENVQKEDVTVIPDDERVQIIEFPGKDDDNFSSEDESSMAMEMNMNLMMSAQDFFPSKKNCIDRTVRGSFKRDKTEEEQDGELVVGENTNMQKRNQSSPQPTQGSSRLEQELSSPEDDCLYLNSKEDEKHKQKLSLYMKNIQFGGVAEGSGGQHMGSVAKTMAPPNIGSKRYRDSIENEITGNPNNNYREKMMSNGLDFQEPLAKKKRGRPRKQKSEDGLCNDENFIMSPESDVSSTSEKSSGSREGKIQQKSRQHYTSDDLYKPRPLFGSSSRRKRRSSPA